MVWCAAPGCDFARMMTAATAKMTASTGKAYRSKAYTRLYPKNAIAICTATMMIRQRIFGRWVSVFSANVPPTLFTANQPIPAVIEFSPAGSTFPQYPKPSRDSTICGTP